VARLCGDDTAWLRGRVSFNPLKHIDPFGTILLPALLMLTHSPILFGYAKPVPVNFRALRKPKRDSVFVAAASPAMNLALSRKSEELPDGVSASSVALWPPRLTAYSVGRLRRERVLIVLKLAPFFGAVALARFDADGATARGGRRSPMTMPRDKSTRSTTRLLRCRSSACAPENEAARGGIALIWLALSSSAGGSNRGEHRR
jgi:hypothetical protein